MSDTKIWWPSLGRISPAHKQLYVTSTPASSSASASAVVQSAATKILTTTLPTSTSTRTNHVLDCTHMLPSRDGIVVLGAPIGTPRFVIDAVERKTNEINTALCMLTRMEDAHVAFTLSRACFGACRLNFLLHTVPTSLATPGAKLFDTHLYEFTREIAGGILARDVFDELQLPVRIHERTLPHLGAGLTSPKRTAPCACLSSVAAVGRASQSLLFVSTLPDAWSENQRDALRNDDQNSRLLALQTNPSAKDAHQRFLTSTRACENPPDLQQIEREPGRWNQTELTKLTHLHAAARFYNTTNTISRRNASTLQHLPRASHISLRSNRYRTAQLSSGAKDWLRCIPSPGLDTHINHAAFTTWFGYYCRAPKRIGDTRPRRHCSQRLDEMGDHLLACGSGLYHSISPRVRRHDQLVRQVAGLLTRAHRSPIVEPRSHDIQHNCTELNSTAAPELALAAQTNSRPDIRALGASGGEDLLDISVHHPLA